MPGGGSQGGGLPGGDSGGGLPGGDAGGAGTPGGQMPGAGMPGGGSDGGGGTGSGGDAPFGKVEGPGGPDGSGSGPGGAGGSGNVGGLDDEFDKSLGDFDDALLEEQGEVASQGRDMEALEKGRSGGGSGGSPGGIVVANDTSGQSQGGGGDGSGGEGQPQSSIDTLSSEQVGSRTPEDLPPGFDDDIVARQLREAALAEEDPELREKLWDEYRAYKGIN